MQNTQFQRTLLWVVFGMSLFLLWDKWQAHNGQPSMFGPSTSQQKPAGGNAVPGAAPAAKGDATVPSASAPAGAPAAGAPAPAAGPASETGKLVKFANDVLSLDIDTLGGQVKRSELLQHKDLEDKTRNVVLLQDVQGSLYIAQSGWVGAPQGASFPTHRTSFTVVDGPKEAGGGSQLVLSAESGGLKVVRTLTLKKGEYVLEVKDELTNAGTTPLTPTLYAQLTRDGNKPAGESKFYSTYTGPVVYTEKGHFQKVDFSDIEKGKASFEKSAGDGWLGIIQHYFVAAWIPADKLAREYYADRVDTNLYRVGAKAALPELAPGASTSVVSKLLVSPQDQHTLEKIATGLDLSVDYGWLTVIAKPIFWLLQWLHALVGNWGWAIVLLTLVIKTAFFPLQAASYKSMARMKAVTPRMTAIRERYGDDRARMNQAMMELYKEEKINPLGGCLPIVVQIPVFIALYWVLLASVEMRNAPWLGWIHDLAAPDPFYILPGVMAITMFIQTKLNPTPPDPVQAKMMMIMPLVFSVMFFFFPSGLVLYWLVNNVYSIAQQWVITKKMEGSAKKA
jgi:YidC/Oxa1 family membrane protein insertase